MLKAIKENKLLILILVVAAVSRFAAVTYTPPSLNWDEVSHGYNAYSILKTGKDEWGNTLPTIFRAYGDYKLPVYIYATIPSIAIFGLNTFAVRLPSILAGIATVLFTYLLTRKLLSGKNSRKYALVAAFLVTLEPWTFFLSRGAFEANLALTFIVAGMYFFLRGLEKPKSLIPSAVLLGLSVWTYNSARILVPLLLLSLVFIYREKTSQIFKSHKKTTMASLFIAIIFFVPMSVQLLNPQGQARFGRVTILDEGAINEINIARNSSSTSPFMSRLLHNKITYLLPRVAKNWAAHFLPNFLFFKGGDHYQFSVPGHGILYPINAVFILLGLWYLFKKDKKTAALIVSWLVLAPIPSSLTREAPHVLRAITVLPIPMMLTALGVVSVFECTNKKSLLYAIYVIVVLLSFENYAVKYFTEYRNQYSWAWQYGYEQTVNYVKPRYGNYDKIVISKAYGEPHEYFLFFWPWLPEKYQNDPKLNRFYQSNWYWVDQFDKFDFVNDWQIDEDGSGNYTFNLESKETVQCTPKMFDCLLITSPGNVPEGWNKLETINFLDTNPAFEIYEN